jgi:pimeloyl-ACP methyl ester carboxylesterase
LLNPGIDLDTHILDVVNTMRWLELRDVALVGHSYGGMVVSGVTESMQQSIASIAMLDALFPSDRQCAADLLPAPIRHSILKRQAGGATAGAASSRSIGGRQRERS